MFRFSYCFDPCSFLFEMSIGQVDYFSKSQIPHVRVQTPPPPSLKLRIDHFSDDFSFHLGRGCFEPSDSPLPLSVL